MVRRRVASEKRRMADGLRQCIRPLVESVTPGHDGFPLALVPIMWTICEMQDSGYDTDGNPVFNRRFCGDERKRSDIRDRASGNAAEDLLARNVLTVAAIDRIRERLPIPGFAIGLHKP